LARASYKERGGGLPAEKHEDKDIILSRLQTSDGQIQRLAMMSDTAKNFATQILLIIGQKLIFLSLAPAIGRHEEPFITAGKITFSS